MEFYFSIRIIIGTGTQNQSLDVLPVGVCILGQLLERRSGVEFTLAKNVLEHLQNILDQIYIQANEADVRKHSTVLRAERK